MGLVVVAAGLGDLRESTPVVLGEEIGGLPEAHDPGDRLRAEADLLTEPGVEMATAAFELGGEGADRHLAARPREPAPGPGNVRRGSKRRLDPGEGEGVEDLEARLPPGRVVETLDQQWARRPPARRRGRRSAPKARASRAPSIIQAPSGERSTCSPCSDSPSVVTA